MKSIPYVVLTLVLLAAPLPAAEQPGIPVDLQPSPIPSVPLMKRVPDFTEWAVNIMGRAAVKKQTKATDSPMAEQESSRLKRIEVTKTGPVIHEELTTIGGGKTDKWFFQGSIQVTNHGDRLSLLSGGARDFSDPVRSDYGARDFEGFDWISPQNYRGIGSLQGRACMVFIDSKSDGDLFVTPMVEEMMRRQNPKDMMHGSPGKGRGSGQGSDANGAKPTPKLKPGTVIACIDLETRLPLSLVTDSETRIISYINLPKVIQTVPENISQTLRQEENRTARLSRVRPNS